MSRTKLGQKVMSSALAFVLAFGVCVPAVSFSAIADSPETAWAADGVNEYGWPFEMPYNATPVTSFDRYNLILPDDLESSFVQVEGHGHVGYYPVVMFINGKLSAGVYDDAAGAAGFGMDITIDGKQYKNTHNVGTGGCRAFVHGIDLSYLTPGVHECEFNVYSYKEGAQYESLEITGELYETAKFSIEVADPSATLQLLTPTSVPSVKKAFAEFMNAGWNMPDRNKHEITYDGAAAGITGEYELVKTVNGAETSRTTHQAAELQTLNFSDAVVGDEIIYTVSENGAEKGHARVRISATGYAEHPPVNGTEYTAIKLFDADVVGDADYNQEPVGSNIQSEHADEIAAVLNDRANGFDTYLDEWMAEKGIATANAQVCAEFISEMIDHQPRVGLEVSDFGMKLAKALAKVDGLSKTTIVADAEGAGIPGSGYYLIVRTDDLTGDNTAATSPIFAALHEGENFLTLKVAIPTIKKEIQEDSDGSWGDDADHNLGQEVNYRLTGTIADNIEAYETYSYSFTDSWDGSKMTLKEGSVKVSINGTDITGAAEIETKNTNDDSQNMLAQYDFSGDPDAVLDSDAFAVTHTSDSAAGVVFESASPLFTVNCSNGVLTIDIAAAQAMEDQDGCELYICYPVSANEHFTGATRYKSVPLSAFTEVQPTPTSTLTVSFADLKAAYPALSATDSIVVEYTAYQSGTTASPEGIANEAFLEYSNNPMVKDSIGTTPKVQTKDYSYAIRIHKTDQNTGENLAGVEFSVKTKEGKYLALVDGKFVEQDEEFAFTTDENGLLVLDGIDADNYTITETKALPGYDELGSDIKVGIDGTVRDHLGMSYSFNATLVSLGEGAEAEGVAAHINVLNVKQIGLPSTGEMGLGLIVLVAAAAIAFGIASRRRNDKANTVMVVR